MVFGFINFYTSDASTGEFRSFVRLVGENMGQPVLLHGLSALPSPDTMRPTRQQLRVELAWLKRELKASLNLAKRYAPYQGLADAVAQFLVEADKLNTRIMEIEQVLSQEKEGQQP